MDAPGSRIVADRYELRGILGEGGTGIVYDAVRLDDNTSVALKVMHSSLAGDRQVRGRFQREAAILRRLEGPHICPILDFGEVPGDDPAGNLLYIAIPKIDGPSLAEILGRERTLPLDRAIDIMTEVLAALESAHAQGVIHRDLKPANVLLRGGEKVVVVDFGMSKIVTGGSMGTTNLTTHNMVFGTPEYMSPEHARGDELDVRCDVYAAGVMLYEMLTGAPPFTAPTPLGVLTAHLTSDLEPPSKKTPSGRITPELETVMLCALSRDRDGRYSTAAAFAEALRKTRSPSSVAPRSGGNPGPDAFAATMPVVGLPAPDRSGPLAIVNDDRKVETTPPPISRQRRDSAPSRPSGPPARAAVDSEEQASTRTWLLLWIVVGLASIAIGVYFALR